MSMQVDPPAMTMTTTETSAGTFQPAPARPSSAMPIRPLVHPPPETSVGIATTVPYVPVTSQTGKKEFGYIQKRLRKTSMDVGIMVR
jgi:hypothetical protein